MHNQREQELDVFAVAARHKGVARHLRLELCVVLEVELHVRPHHQLNDAVAKLEVLLPGPALEEVALIM